MTHPLPGFPVIGVEQYEHGLRAANRLGTSPRPEHVAHPIMPLPRQRPHWTSILVSCWLDAVHDTDRDDAKMPSRHGLLSDGRRSPALANRGAGVVMGSAPHAELRTQALSVCGRSFEATAGESSVARTSISKAATVNGFRSNLASAGRLAPPAPLGM